MNFTIESIKLLGFTGMWLNNIQHFEYNVKSSISLILGRNGSGKSRLMFQLSPLAPAKGDLYDKGMKELVCNNGKRYRLTCRKVGHGLKCTIVNETDDEVVCENANPSVYNRFVKELFNYDKDLHDLFTGQVKLTTMKTPDRRKWFSLLSESDLTYALSFYKKAREQQRDISGTIKNLRKSIGALRPKILECDEDYQRLGTRIEVLQTDISKIEKMLMELNYDKFVNSTSMEQSNRVMQSLRKEAMSLQMWLPENHESLNILEIEKKLSGIGVRKESLLSKLEDLENRIARSISIQSIDVAGFERTVSEKYDAITQWKNGLVLFPRLETCDTATLEQAASGLDHYCDALSGAMTDLTTDLPIDNSKGRLAAYREQAGKLSSDLNKLERSDGILTAQLKHAESVCDVTCVKCTHVFKPGIDLDEIASVKQQLRANHDKTVQVKAELEEVDKYIQQYIKFVNASETIATAAGNFRVNAAVSLLFTHLFEAKAFIENPSKHIGVIKQFQVELPTAVRIAHAKSIIAKYEGEIKLAKATQAENNTDLEEMRDGTLAQLDNCTNMEQRLQSDLKLATEIAHTRERAGAIQEGLITELKSQNRLNDVMIANIKADVLNEHKAQLWDLLTTARQRFQDMEKERQRLAFYEQELDDALLRDEASKLLVKTMSPDEGILAKYLYQCITRITDLMSEYISHIWGYEMKILPCEVADGEMDYKFPFWTKDKSRPNEDVSLGSKAQKEVIDFVFMLATYRAMGLESYPLLVDETLAAFDEGHRDKAITFIKEIVAKGHHSQCFMVSHDSTTHFKLTHADFVVIDPDGITLPQDHNKNVIIK